jgi:hypothetical protein
VIRRIATAFLFSDDAKQQNTEIRTPIEVESLQPSRYRALVDRLAALQRSDNLPSTP